MKHGSICVAQLPQLMTNILSSPTEVLAANYFPHVIIKGLGVS